MRYFRVCPILGATREVRAVFSKPLYRCLSSILFLAFSNHLLFSKTQPQPASLVTISVHNDVGVPPGTLQQAEEEAARIFRQAGIEVHWLNCPLPASPQEAGSCQEAVFPAHLQLRIARRSLGLRAGTLGISFLAPDGRGCQADLFYEPMQRLFDLNNVNLATLLGHVAAHEVGHLLLGSNSHSPTGIMHAHWAGEDTRTTSIAELRFSKTESERMRERLSTELAARR